MFNLQALTIASAALSLFSGVDAWQNPPQPSCTDFTPFAYKGCFQDLSSPNALLYSSGLNTQNMTVEICVAFCKGNDYKYAGLEYYGECFCGASVNGPQVAESYCTFPCTGDNTETCGGNDYINIYQDTTFPTVDDTTISDYTLMGCYSEGTSGRSLAYQQDLSITNMTVEECLFTCKDGGYDFAGVEFGQECYCGVVLGNGTLPLDSTSCNMPCTGNSSETCGGRSTLDLYVATDLESTQPCNGGNSSTSSSSAPPSTTSTSSTSSSPPSTTSSTTTTTTTSTTSSSSPPSTTSSTSTTSTTSTTCTTSTKGTTPTTSTKSTISTTSTKSTPPTTTSTTKTTASLCTSTVTVSPSPTCEYKCGSWCSNPLPSWTDQNSCWSAFSSCSVQLASCFLQAGFPDSLNCFQFSTWCNSVSSFCTQSCPGGNCNKSNCLSKSPPPGWSKPTATISTTVYTCPPQTTTTSKTSTKTTPTPTTSTCVPIPTCSNICTQPSNPSKGYTSNSPVGGIPLPCLTCNNLLSDYKTGNQFKLYTSPDTTQCPSYSRGGGSSGCGQGCQDSCDSQYNSCIGTYAEGCKSNGWKRGSGDTYSSATTKCKNQWNDCYGANQGVSGNGRCTSWNQGWY